MFSAVVLAADNSTSFTDDVTRNETAVMGSTRGAEMRLLQLERRVSIHNAIAQRVIDVITAKGNDTLALESLLQQSNVLVEEIKVAPRAPAQDAVKSFVDLKQDANEIIKEFRDTAKPFLSSEDRSNLSKVKAELETELNKPLIEKIKTERKEHNVERLTKHFDSLNVTANNILALLKDGSLTPERARETVKEHYKNQSSEQKNASLQRVKSVLITRVDQKIARIQETETNINERRSQRLDDRMGKIVEKAPMKVVQKIKDQMNVKRATPLVAKLRNETVAKLGGQR